MTTPFMWLVGLLLTHFCLATTEPPNLIIILTDDHGYHDVGFNGCTDIPTPHLDSIAQNGIRFTRGYVSYPLCGPSRAGLLTGRYQDRFGFSANPTSDPTNPAAGIPLEQENIAEVLKKVGYTSAIVGKWHMGTHPVHHPLNRGFDHFYGFLTGGHHYLPNKLTINDLTDVDKNKDWYRTRLLSGHTRVDMEGYLTDELSDRAVSFIEKQAESDTPFLLYLAYNAPHRPLQATKKYLSRFSHISDARRRRYAAMLSAVDDGVGRILTSLRKTGIEKDTLVVFLSDNGGAYNNGSENSPLRGWKSDLFEGGLRVPFAMQWKGHLPEGMDYTYPIISLDIMATITELANAPIDADRPLDGVNLIPYLTGVKSGAPHRQLFWRKFEENLMAVLDGNMKLVNHQLFDLDVDISEQENLSNVYAGDNRTYAAHNSTRLALTNSWEKWNTENKDLVFPTSSVDQWWSRDNQ